MRFLMDKIVEEHFPRRETVLLRFDKVDSQIARNWRKSGNTKDIFDDKTEI
jgi:hypothetical protein